MVRVNVFFFVGLGKNYLYLFSGLLNATVLFFKLIETFIIGLSDLINIMLLENIEDALRLLSYRYILNKTT